MSVDHLLEFEVARVVIEAKSPFLIGVADGDGFHDATFTTDANGLPTIPGETLAGVLRHALAADQNDDPDAVANPVTNDACKRAFGYQIRGAGEPSRVEISWAQVHDRHDAPVPFRRLAVDGDKDEVLGLLAAGVSRDHVRINKNGVADDGGKFDVLLVPAGARFTFEIRILKGADVTAQKLLQLLNLPEVMIGRAGRSGMGDFKVVRAHHRVFDLRKDDDRRLWRMLPVALDEKVPHGVLNPLTVGPSTGRWKHGKLLLQPDSSWYVGGTHQPDELVTILRSNPNKTDRGAEVAASWDRFPLAEKRIEWKDGKGSVTQSPDWLLPGSSVKGALRHRMSFYARALGGALYDPAKPDTLQDVRREPGAELALFGAARGGDHDPKLIQGPGRIRISDARITPSGDLKKELAPFEHVSIDRFTQGPIDGRLFNEVALFKGPAIEVEIAVDTARLPESEPNTLKALKRALDDVMAGRLALGAAASRGHGIFRGTITWDDGKTPWEAEA